MQNTESNPSQGLGIAGIILGILSIFFAIIPCTMFLGVVLAVIGLILTIVGLNQATKLNAQKGLLIAGLITSILGILIAGLWGVAFTEMFQQNKVFKKIEYVNDDFDSFDSNQQDSIQFESDKTMQELEQKMEGVELQKPARPDSTNNPDYQ